MFRATVKKKLLDESHFRHSYGNYFETAILKVTSATFKVLSQLLQGALTIAFERHLTVEDFTDVDRHTC